MKEMSILTAITMKGNWVGQPNAVYHGESFRWDEVRRAQLRAGLDAYYAVSTDAPATNCATSSTLKKATAKVSLGRRSAC